MEFVAAANVGVANPDLRHRSAPTGKSGHFCTDGGLAVDADFLEVDALAGQQLLGAHAEGAIVAAVDDNVSHVI